jgi:hypothetical protein
MSLAEAEAYIGEYPLSVVGPSAELAELTAAARAHIGSRIKATERAGVPLRAERLRRRLRLSGFGFFALCCALAAAIDRGFERLFVALHGDVENPFPTLGAVLACYDLAFPEEPAGEPAEESASWRRLLNPSAPENRLLFKPASPDKPPLLRAVALRPAALGYLLGQFAQSRELAACGEPLAFAGAEPLFADEPIGRARAALAAMSRRDLPRLCILCGPAGIGKKLILSRAAAWEGARLLPVRLEELPPDADNVIDELVASALFWKLIPCLCAQDAGRGPALAKILAALRPWRVGAVLVTERLQGNLAHDGYLVSRVDFTTPSLAQSLAFWQTFAARLPSAPSVDLERLAAKYTLTPGRIEAALRAASEMADGQGLPVDAAMLDAAILLGNTGRLSEIADRIPLCYGWDDLVLGEASKRMLRDICNRLRYRYLVETTWGFGGKSAYGRGLSILLYGPPGTGKTMSAQVIAGELGLPLYRINLAQIISKYIGETAKNLDAVFTEAKNSNVVLFFDEADALFSKRTDVKSSNDRHANSESSYLLQKIEEYTGVSILATNLANNFDEAFRRRIGYMINIHMPSPEQRLELWRGAIPAAAPLSPDVDLNMLAEHLELSGSVIKSAALQAAYFAADENAAIGMGQLARAVRRELQKLGKSEPHFLSLYPE